MDDTGSERAAAEAILKSFPPSLHAALARSLGVPPDALRVVSPSAQGARWEYAVVALDSRDALTVCEVLNRYGEDNWEHYAVCGSLHYFKRITSGAHPAPAGSDASRGLPLAGERAPGNHPRAAGIDSLLSPLSE